MLVQKEFQVIRILVQKESKVKQFGGQKCFAKNIKIQKNFIKKILSKDLGSTKNVEKIDLNPKKYWLQNISGAEIFGPIKFLFTMC